MRRLTVIGLLTLLHLAPAHSLSEVRRGRGLRRAFAPPTSARSVPAGGLRDGGGRPGAAQASVDPLAALPPSDAVVTIDMKRLVDEAVPRLLANDQTSLAPVAAALADLKSLTGLDPGALRRVAVGLRYPAAADGTARADVGRVWVAQNIEAWQLPALMRRLGPGKYREEQYGGKTLYVAVPAEAGRNNAAAGAGADGLVFTTLDANTAAFGDLSRVRSTVDAGAGRGARVSAELIAAATRNPNALLGAAGLFQPSLMPGVVPAPQSGGGEMSRLLSSLKQFYAYVELTPAGFGLTVVVTAADPEQAKALGDVLTAIKTLGGLTPAKTALDRLGSEMLKGLAVSAVGAEVRVRAELTRESVVLLMRLTAAQVYFVRGRAHTHEGEWDAAVADYDRVIALDPESVNAYINRGRARADKGELDAAIADYDRAISLDPDASLAYNNRSYAKLEKGDFDGAIADSNRAIALDPGLAYAYNNRGFALAQKGKLDEAMADYDKSIALDPNNALAYSNRGYARYRMGDFERAAADFDKAIALDPGRAEDYQNRGAARREKGDFDGAIADFDKALAINPKSADAYNGRGLARYYKENLDGAISDYDRAIALDPNRAVVYANRGLALADKENFDAAIADYDKSLALNPALPEAYNGRGLARYYKEEFGLAIADFDKAIALSPDFAEVYGNRALSRLALGRDAEAARDFKECFRLDEALRPAFEALAVEVKKKRRAKARPY